MDSNHEMDRRLRGNKCHGCSVDQRRKSMDAGRIIGGMFKTTLKTGDKLFLIETSHQVRTVSYVDVSVEV